MIKYGIVIGSDCSQSWPGDVLEYTASSDGTAFILGPKSGDTVAYFEGTYSVMSDTPNYGDTALINLNIFNLDYFMKMI